MGSNGYGKLSASFVSKHKKPGTYNDGGNLYLQISSPTARSWVFKFWDRDVQRVREMGLGSSHLVSLVQARTLAHEYRQLLHQGVNPLQARRTGQAQQRLDATSKATTFRQCAKAYIEAHGSAWKSARHRQQWTNSLEQRIYPSIGDMPVAAIDVATLHKVLQPIWMTAPETGTRIRARIENILDWAKVLNYRSGENPARWKGSLEKLLPKPSKVRKGRHHPSMNYADVSAFLAKLRNRGTVAATALEFAILTAARTGEAIGARWAEIDMDSGIWTIPAERMKAGVTHKVPLSEPALKILKGITPDQSGFVFVGGSSGKRLAQPTLLRTMTLMKIRGATPHGFRSSFRTWAAECMSFPREIAEAALSHANGDKVEAAYQRGDYFRKRRELMDQWAQHCTVLVAEATRNGAPRFGSQVRGG
jgi:integrase